MLNLKSAFALLLFINSITALPTVPHPNSQPADGKLDRSTNKIPLDAQPGFRYPSGLGLSVDPPPEKWKAHMVERYGPECAAKFFGAYYGPRKTTTTVAPATEAPSSATPSEKLKAKLGERYGRECAAKILSASSGQTKKTTTTPTGAAPTATAAPPHGKKISHHRRSDDDKKESSHSNNKKKKDETPLVRIFPDGNFSPFTIEESQQFLLLLHQQSQGQKPPKVVVGGGAPSQPSLALESINEEGRKDSKEGSVYNKSRKCENNGQWCKLPQEGSVLITGPGIEACTYYKEEGKIISYTPCWFTFFLKKKKISNNKKFKKIGWGGLGYGLDGFIWVGAGRLHGKDVFVIFYSLFYFVQKETGNSLKKKKKIFIEETKTQLTWIGTIHTYIHMHTYIHAYMHTYIHTYLRIHT